MCRTSLLAVGSIVGALVIALDTNTAHAQIGGSRTVYGLSIGGGASPPIDRYWGPSSSYAPRYGSRSNSRYSPPRPWYVYPSGPYTYYRPYRPLYGTDNSWSSNNSGRSRTTRFGRRRF